SHERLEKYRRRTVGGSTSAWGGRCIPFDPVDFMDRQFVADSGWPFQYDDLDSYYRTANQICEAGDYGYQAGQVFQDKQSEIFPGFDNEDLSSGALERWSPPTHFGKKYFDTLNQAQNLQLIYNLTCQHIQAGENGEHIDHIRVQSPEGIVHTVKADQFILAGGCVENTRMLLASNDVHANGLGNQHDALGRYYMAHLWGIINKVKLNPKVLGTYMHNFERDREGVYIRRRFGLSQKAQIEEEVLNIIGFFFRPQVEDPSHNDPIMSIIHLMKERKYSPKSIFEAQALRHWGNVIKGFPRAMSQIIEISKQRKQERRLPYVITPKNSSTQYFYYQAEQAPNVNSRITLHPTEKDETGVPRALVDIRFLPIDLKTVKVFHQKMSERFLQTGIGDFVYDEEAVEANFEQMVNNYDSGSHHIGSTRISDDPKTGVVDRDCKVHGIQNLYVAGASVFPTGSHANPTLTIVALALRLADKLKQSQSLKVSLSHEN
ncbi:MAG: GMC oxidoreductase, partial [Bacteroidota bacterium]